MLSESARRVLELHWAKSSSRARNDVFVGEDSAAPLINAATTGDIPALRDILQTSPELAIESQERIDSERRPAKNKDDVRGVTTSNQRNLERALFAAAENGQAEVMPILFEFGLKSDIPFDHGNCRIRTSAREVIERKDLAVLEAYVKALPKLLQNPLSHGEYPLDCALRRSSVEMVEAILRLGGNREFPKEGSDLFGYASSRMYWAARYSTKKVRLLIENGYPVTECGALHPAAEGGQLDTIRLLIEEYGEDVNGVLPAGAVTQYSKGQMTSWRPMHHAAHWGKEEAMKLLESYGARTDFVDFEGKTPADLSEERKARMAKLEGQRKAKAESED